MAKTKKFKRHRVSGASLNPKSPVVMIAATAAGFFLADTINGQIDKLLPAAPAPVAPAPATTGALDPKTMDSLVMVGELGLGAFLLMGKGKSSLLKTAGGGLLAGAGLKRLLVKTGAIKGYNVNGYRVNGYQSVPVIGGYQSVPVIGNSRRPAQLQGVPSQLSGRMRVMGSVGLEHTEGSGSGIMGSSGCMQ